MKLWNVVRKEVFKVLWFIPNGCFKGSFHTSWVNHSVRFVVLTGLVRCSKYGVLDNSTAVFPRLLEITVFLVTLAKVLQVFLPGRESLPLLAV